MKQKNKKFEFSKIIMVGFGAAFFVAEAFLMFMIYKVYQLFAAAGTLTYLTAMATMVGAFCTFTAAPVAVAAGFYSNKAKAENLEKIKGSSQGSASSD